MKWVLAILAACVAGAVYAAYDLNRTLTRALRLPEDEQDD